MQAELGTGPSVGDLPFLAFPRHPSTDERELIRSLERLKERGRAFAVAPIANKQAWLRAAMGELFRRSEEMVRKACEAKRLDFDGPVAAEEWLSGPTVIMRFLRLLVDNLEQLRTRGGIRLGRQIERGRAIVEVLPTGPAERAAYRGFRCESWFEDGVSLRDIKDQQGSFYQGLDPTGTSPTGTGPTAGPGVVTLVLGAGNIAAIPALDVLNKMFVHGQVCLLKMNPVNEYLGPIFERIFAPLIEQGFLAICYGGAEVGAYLCEHPLVDEIHMTGSAATYNRIVWGEPGTGSQARRAAGTPKLTKPLTSELGNITPILVMPGAYSASELDFVAQNIATMVVNNASFNCVAGKLLVLPDTALAERLTALVEQYLAQVTPRYAYYPGATRRFHELTASAPRLKTIGEEVSGRLPWALIQGLDPKLDHPQFTTEPFCSILSETRLPTTDALEFLERATEFVNTKVWGTLACALFLPEGTRRDAALSAGVERAIENLRYGCVCVNHWPGVAFGFGSNAWGGAPGAEALDIQSGIGWAHNAAMLDAVRKVVLYGPLVVRPAPIWFAFHKNAVRAARRLLAFEYRPSVSAFARLAMAAV